MKGMLTCGDYLNGYGMNNSFNTTYNNVFSPKSNPYTNTWGGSTNNFTMEVYYQYGNYLYAKFYLTNPYDGVPSKPQNLQVSNYNSHPGLIWIANLEPDLSGYIIDRAESGYWEYNIAQVSTTSFIDYNVDINPVFEDVVTYKIRVIDTQGKVSASSESVSIEDAVVHKDNISPDENLNSPLAYSLETAYPNPFNPSTQINYSIKKQGFVTLKVFDILGRETANLVNEVKPEGNFTVTFNAGNLPSGIYFYSLTADDFHQTKKMILMK